MSLDLLGEGFDLHGGGIDLAFPHHENERAQAVASGRAFARHWAHNGHIVMGGEKMSKSLGNFTSLSDLLEQTDGRAYRLLVAPEPLPVSGRSRPPTRWRAPRKRCDASTPWPVASTSPPSSAPFRAPDAAAAGADPDASGRFTDAMDDDLDTPKAFGAVFDLVAAPTPWPTRATTAAARALAVTVAVLCGAVGLALRGGQSAFDTGRRRAWWPGATQARAAGDWAQSDAIRAELETAGLDG